MHRPRCSPLHFFCFCPCLAAALALAACDAPKRARQEAGPAASSASAAPLPAQAAPAQAGPARVAVEARAMGTSLLLAAYTSEAMDEAAIRARLDKAIAEIRRLEGLMTTWRPDSELSRVNAAAGKNAVAVSPETLSVIEKSVWMSQQSEGVFDITFEAMHGLWKFDQDLEENIPPLDAVEKARKLIDFRQIKIDHAARTVKLAKAGMRMSLGGIAKGYAVDALSDLVRAEPGVTAALVEIGGELKGFGVQPDGQPWWVGIDGQSARVALCGWAVATSGDGRRAFMHDGRLYSHTIDAATCAPTRSAVASATVFDRFCWRADALATALIVMGEVRALAFAEAHAIPCLLSVRDGFRTRTVVSPRLAGWTEGEA